MSLGLYIALGVVGILLVIAVIAGLWTGRIGRWKNWRRTKYSHDITSSSVRGEILAVLPSRPSPVTHSSAPPLTPNPNLTPMTPLGLEFPHKAPINYLNYLRTGQSHLHSVPTVPSVSGNLDLNLFLYKSDSMAFSRGRIAGVAGVTTTTTTTTPTATNRLNPPYRPDGPPTYHQAIQIQQFRNSIR